MYESPEHRVFKIILAALLVLFFLVGFGIGLAWSHEAPTGWKYPFACCSNHDCRAVDEKDIVEDARGFTIAGTHELLQTSDPRIRQSPDGEYHWCSVAGADDSRTICLFVPPRGY